MNNLIALTKITPEIFKRAQLITLLQCDQVARLDDIVAATGWLPNTTRAALTGLRKSGLFIESGKVDGIRRYRIMGLVQ